MKLQLVQTDWPKDHHFGYRTCYDDMVRPVHTGQLQCTICQYTGTYQHFREEEKGEEEERVEEEEERRRGSGRGGRRKKR